MTVLYTYFMAKFTIRKSGSKTELVGVRPSELKAMALAGELAPDDEICRDGEIKWHLASSVNGLKFGVNSEVAESKEALHELQKTLASLQSKIKEMDVSLQQSAQEKLLLEDKLNQAITLANDKTDLNNIDSEKDITALSQEESVLESTEAVIDQAHIELDEPSNVLAIEKDIEIKPAVQDSVAEEEDDPEQLDGAVSLKDKAKAFLVHEKMQPFLKSLSGCASWIFAHLKTKRGIAAAGAVFVCFVGLILFSSQKTELEKNFIAVEYAANESIEAAASGDVQNFLTSISKLADLVIFISANREQLAEDINSMSSEEIIELSTNYVTLVLKNVQIAFSSGQALYQKMTPEEQSEYQLIYSNDIIKNTIAFGLISGMDSLAEQIQVSAYNINDSLKTINAAASSLSSIAILSPFTFVYYLVTFLNIAMGLLILRFGLVKYSLTLAVSVLWTFVLMASIIELVGLGGGEYLLGAGIVFAVLTYVFAKPFTYIAGFLLGYVMVSAPIWIISSSIFGESGGPACFSVILGIAAGVYVIKKYREIMRVIVMGYFGGGTTGMALSYLLLAVLWPINSPIGWLVIMFSPYVLGTAFGLMVLFTKPEWSKKYILYPSDDLENN